MSQSNVIVLNGEKLFLRSQKALPGGGSPMRGGGGKVLPGGVPPMRGEEGAVLLALKFIF